MSLRTRLLLTTSAIVFVIVGALSIGISTIISRQLMHEIDNTLDARIEAIAATLRENIQIPSNGRRQRNPLSDALMPTRFDTVTQVIDPAGTVIIALGEVDLPITQQVLNIANNPAGGSARFTTSIGGVKYRMLTIPLINGGALQLAKDISDETFECDWLLLAYSAFLLQQSQVGGLHGARQNPFSNLQMQQSTSH
jgi:hypothetical protein